MNTTVFFHDAMYLAQIVLERRSFLDVIAGMTREYVIEKFHFKWNLAIRAHLEICLDTERRYSIERNLDYLLMNFDSMNVETQDS